MGNEKCASPGTRKPYHPPTVKMVPLRPDETVLGGCKTASTSGPNYYGGTFCEVPTACYSTTS